MKRSLLSAVVLTIALAAGAQTAPKSGYFTTSDHVRLHYLEAGTGPAVVFIPGWTMPAWIWEKQIAYFTPRYHVVAIDPRSQGESEKPPDGNYPERRARDYKEIVDYLKLQAPVLVGWSMGVHELLTYADEFGPGSVRGLVLVDGFLWDKPNPKMGTFLTAWMHAFQRTRRKSIDEFVRTMYHKPQTDDYLRRVVEASLLTPTNTAVLLIHNMVDREDWTPVLAKLAEAKTPVLGVFAPQQKDTVELLRAKVPGARVLVFEDAGHALFVDDAERFNTAVQEFVEGIKGK